MGDTQYSVEYSVAMASASVRDVVVGVDSSRASRTALKWAFRHMLPPAAKRIWIEMHFPSTPSPPLSAAASSPAHLPGSPRPDAAALPSPSGGLISSTSATTSNLHFGDLSHHHETMMNNPSESGSSPTTITSGDTNSNFSKVVGQLPFHATPASRNTSKASSHTDEAEAPPVAERLMTCTLLHVQERGVSSVHAAQELVEGIVERAKEELAAIAEGEGEGEEQRGGAGAPATGGEGGRAPWMEAVKVVGEVEEGDAREAMVAAAERMSADLIVMGSRRISSVSQMLSGSRGNFCANFAPCPVLIVRMSPEAEAKKMSRRKMRVVLAIDRSPESFHACAWTLRNFIQSSDPVFFVHATREPSYANVDKQSEDSLKRARESVNAHIHKLTQHSLHLRRPPTLDSVHVLEGDPREVLLEFVERQQIDLMVLGTRSQSDIPGMTLGSVSSFMVHCCPCSLLLYRPKKKF